MSSLKGRLKRLESAIGKLPVEPTAHKEAWRRYWRGEDNGESIKALPELPWRDLQVIAISFMTEVRHAAREMSLDPASMMRFGKDGPTVRESMDRDMEAQTRRPSGEAKC